MFDHLYNFTDTKLWKQRDLLTISDIYCNRVLHPFEQVHMQCNLTHTFFYTYYLHMPCRPKYKGLIHLLWACSIISSYWKHILDLVSSLGWLNDSKLLRTWSSKATPKHNISTTMLHGGYKVLLFRFWQTYYYSDFYWAVFSMIPEGPNSACMFNGRL